MEVTSGQRIISPRPCHSKRTNENRRSFERRFRSSKRVRRLGRSGGSAIGAFAAFGGVRAIARSAGARRTDEQLAAVRERHVTPVGLAGFHVGLRVDVAKGVLRLVAA